MDKRTTIANRELAPQSETGPPVDVGTRVSARSPGEIIDACGMDRNRR